MCIDNKSNQFIFGSVKIIWLVGENTNVQSVTFRQLQPHLLLQSSRTDIGKSPRHPPPSKTAWWIFRGHLERGGGGSMFVHYFFIVFCRDADDV